MFCLGQNLFCPGQKLFCPGRWTGHKSQKRLRVTFIHDFSFMISCCYKYDEYRAGIFEKKWKRPENRRTKAIKAKFIFHIPEKYLVKN